MIIKSLSRKDKNFGQLLKYIFQHGGGKTNPEGVYLHNLQHHDPADIEAHHKAFTEVHRHHSGKKGSNTMYHEIVSFHPADREYLEKNSHVLWDIMREYSQQRAPDAVGVGVVHMNEKHPHMHLMYSGNNLHTSKSSGISKSQFAAVKAHMQTYQKEQYPALTHSQLAIEKTPQQQKSDAEYQLEKRGQTTKKELIRATIVSALSGSKSAFEQTLHQNNIELYYRNKRAVGVLCEDRKYRFSTLLQADSESLKKLTGWYPKPEQEQKKRDQRMKQLQHLRTAAHDHKLPIERSIEHSKRV